MIKFDLFPGGKTQILTMSYDDGIAADRRLVEIFDEHKIRGTFHLNSANLNKNGRLTKEEIPDLFKNHEVSVHTVNHPHLNRIQPTSVLYEILEDKKNLEEICGYPVRGMSLPFGVTDLEVDKLIEACGMKYSRTTVSTNSFFIPENFIRWNPTCHHKNSIENAKNFIEGYKFPYRHKLFYVWGHSYEFDNDNNWDLIEEFCKMMSGHENVWYATNIEIFDYLQAQKGLIISVNEKIIINPSAMNVWVTVDNQPLEIKGGEKIVL